MRPVFIVAALLAAVFLGLFIGKYTTASEPMLDEGRLAQAIEQTLIEKPEILMHAAQAMQAKQREAQQEKGRLAAIQLQDDIFNHGSPKQGEPGGQVTVAEFFDYQCGHCQTMTVRMEQFTDEYPEVLVVYKELPIFGGNSVVAAKAALAANIQDAYVPMHKALMRLGKAKNLNEKSILTAARELGLDVDMLKADMESEAVGKQLADNRQLAQALGFRGTPAFVVRSPVTNNEPKLIHGAVPVQELKRYTIEAK